jgi:LPS export ABC transporter permease LptG/LPS export ABC transporter permease LptF
MAHRILSRYIRQELPPPALMGLCVYTFILLMNLMFQVAELAIRRSLPLPLVLQIVGLAVPRLLVLTLPVAVMVGVMVGLGRMGSDGEIVALSALGVGEAPLYRGALALGVAAWAVSSVLLLWAVPEANYAQHRLTARSIYLTDPAREIQPRVFYEKIPGTLLYAEEVPPRGELHRLFLYRDAQSPEQEEEITLANRAGIAYGSAGSELAIEVTLREGVSHAMNPLRPEGYRVTRFGRQSVRLPPAPALVARLRLLSEPPPRGLREQSLPDLVRTIAEMDRLDNPRARRLMGNEARLELHKQLSLPCASIVLAFLGVPLGLMSRRGSRSASFAVGLGVTLFYWILLTVGEDLLRKEVLPSPFLAAWAPNLLFLAAGGVLSVHAARASLVRGGAALARGGGGLLSRLSGRGGVSSGPPTAVQAAPAPAAPRRAPLRLISLLDRLVASTFTRILALIALSAWGLYLLVEFKGQIDDLLKNQLPMKILWSYLRFRSPALLVDYVVPVASLVAALLAFAHLGRTGELTAMQASGVSRRRAALPLVVAALGLGVVSLLANETILPASNQRAELLRAEIRGKKSPRTHFRPEKRWVFGEQGRLYAYRRSLQGGRTLEGFTLLKIDRESFRMTERWQADHAVWEGGAWRLERGWVRRFGADAEESFEAFATRREAFGEDAEFLAQEWLAPEHMNTIELGHYAHDLASAGYDVRELRVALHRRLMTPWLGLVMVVVALPLAVRSGRSGPLATLGISLALGMIYYAALNVSSKLGEVGVLSAPLAVWGPSLLFTASGAWVLMRVRA